MMISDVYPTFHTSLCSLCLSQQQSFPHIMQQELPPDEEGLLDESDCSHIARQIVSFWLRP